MPNAKHHIPESLEPAPAPEQATAPRARLGRRPTVLTPPRQEALAAISELWPKYHFERAWQGGDVPTEPFFELEQDLNEAVVAARGVGCTWKWIGGAMHMSAAGALMWYERTNLIEPKHRPETLVRRAEFAKDPV